MRLEWLEDDNIEGLGSGASSVPVRGVSHVIVGQSVAIAFGRLPGWTFGCPCVWAF